MKWLGGVVRYYGRTDGRTNEQRTDGRVIELYYVGL